MRSNNRVKYTIVNNFHCLSQSCMFVTINYCLIISGSLCLVFRLTRVHLLPYTYPNLSSPTWVPPCPFRSGHTHVYFGKFPDHKWTEVIPCWHIFLVHGVSVSFCLVFLCVSITSPHHTPHTPVYTRPYPSAPARTRTHPRLHWKSVYSLYFMFLVLNIIQLVKICY